MQRPSDDTPREEQIARLLNTATQLGLNNVEDHALCEVIKSYFLDNPEDHDAQEAELGLDLDLSSSLRMRRPHLYPHRQICNQFLLMSLQVGKLVTFSSLK